MTEFFFERPILNSPYAYPGRHWELDADGQPTNRIIETRRRSDLITPVPKPKKRRRTRGQTQMLFEDEAGFSSDEQEYNPAPIINEIRTYVDTWRNLPNPDQWLVTPETARLLKHWRHHRFEGIRPFFCQIEAVETAIWLSEVAPKLGPRVAKFWAHIKGGNEQANPELIRVALKLATGAGKTTVMAMLIAWQTVNAVRHPNSKQFSRGFLIVTPGITIKDRLRVLLPNDPENYYRHREIVPPDMLADIDRAKIVITNYHAFKLRERIEVAKGTRAAIEGWRGEKLQTLETEGQMLQRVMPELMGMKSIVVLNDEAHHCYRERVQDSAGETEKDLKGEEKDEAKKNNEAARMWISGLEAVKRKLGLSIVYDLSATPFFLRGSGYAEGTLFPWTMSDFSLMDAIECGIVKLPRVPVADNVPGGDTPKFRNLWDHIGKNLPKKGRAASGKTLDPLSLPAELLTALEALYGHYQKTFELWEQEGIGVPPVFIVVCNNTSTSELIYKYISGFHRENDDGSTTLENGRLALFRNYDEFGNRLPRPNTILIDSAQLESGEALDKDFREIAADEIERFRRDIVERTGDIRAADTIDEATLLREVMNTVGKKGKLGEQVRCVVSVSMLTEGWDANTVTHILGVRAFGTQLLCEQVVGRGLRRQSYDLNDDGLFNVEYADVLGIPFDFAAKPVVSAPAKPRETVRVHAVKPDRDALEITFPRVEGYRVELPNERLEANFGPDHVLNLTPELVGPSVTKNQGIIGEGVDLTIAHLQDMRSSTILFHLARHLLYNKYRDPGEEPKLHLFGQLKRITRAWLEGGYLKCSGGTYPAQLLYKEIADMAAERIKAAITETLSGERPVKAILDAYNPTGSTTYVNFTTSKETRWQTDPRKCHINWVICDSDWEAEFCRVAEAHPRVRAYVKNQNLGLEVPYLMGSTPKKYLPDFIVQVNDGGAEPLNLIVEIKGFRGEDAKGKANAMRSYWVPGVNNLGKFGRWAFAEFTVVYEIEAEFNKLIEGFARRARRARLHRIWGVGMAQTAFKTNPVSLEELLKECGSGKIQLPDFQRSWVWDEYRIKSLIASISEAFPVGALMTLEMKAGAADTFARRPIQGAPQEASSQAPDQLLLDGQQRMTSLYQTCMRKQVVETITPRQKLVKRWFYIDIEKALKPDVDREDAILTLPEDRKIKEDFDRKIVLDLSTPEAEYEKLMFPVNQVFDWDAWQDGFGDYWIGKGDISKRELFKQFKDKVLQHFKSYQVPVIALGHDTSHEAVCLVFEKVNTGGKPLDAFELVTAMYAARGYRLRDDWLGAGGNAGQHARLQAFGRMAGQKSGVLEKVASTDFLQAVALLHTKKQRQDAIAAGVKENELPAIRATRQSLLDLPLEAYKANKDRVEQGFTTAAKFLRQQFIYRAIDLPYQTQIVPLAAILAEIGDKWEHAENKRKLARWYWCGIFGELYGSAVESRFAKDIVEVPAWLGGGPEPTTVRDGVLRADRLRSMRSRLSAAYKGIHALLMQEGAKDFRTGQTFDQTVFFDEDVDIHHIFPQDWCGKQGIEPKVYDSIINKAPLSYRTNRRIGGVAPSVYLQRLEAGQKDDPPIAPAMLDSYLETHCIDPKLLRANDFDGFIKDREKRLLALIAKATGHEVVTAGGSSDEEEVPDNIAEDSGLLTSTAA